jgi:benzoyl-CoA 2,3-dioxygenase component A
MDLADSSLIKQHLIDPEICIRCNTCESTCPVGAITHDARNYVVDADQCNLCMACVPPCPTGSIDNWRVVPKAKAYSLAEQLGWDVLPENLSPEELASALGVSAAKSTGVPPAAQVAEAEDLAAPPQGQAGTQGFPFGSRLPPWSAAHAFTHLYGPKSPVHAVKATVSGNLRVTAVGQDYDTHHVVLDLGQTPFPILEGQSVGVIPPGLDASGRPHHARQYSVASPRNGERPGYNHISLTIKRVLEDHRGRPVRGVASNYLCDLKVGDSVELTGPFGASFLMPNHPGSHIVMICTGTGSAPMRAMTEWRRRLRTKGQFDGGRLLLFFGARTREELPYFGPLQTLPRDFIEVHLAFSRMPGQPRQYVQDLMRERAEDLATLLSDPNAYFYVCGLRAMEDGVLRALRDIAAQYGKHWDEIVRDLNEGGRLHIETY